MREQSDADRFSPIVTVQNRSRWRGLTRIHPLHSPFTPHPAAPNAIVHLARVIKIKHKFVLRFCNEFSFVFFLLFMSKNTVQRDFVRS